jgi:hypothetical protein
MLLTTSVPHRWHDEGMGALGPVFGVPGLPGLRCRATGGLEHAGALLGLQIRGSWQGKSICAHTWELLHCVQGDGGNEGAMFRAVYIDVQASQTLAPLSTQLPEIDTTAEATPHALLGPIPGLKPRSRQRTPSRTCSSEYRPTTCTQDPA